MLFRYVTSLTGRRGDGADRSASRAGRGTIRSVDSSHGLGVVRVDGRLADVTVSAGYKFLCATQMGILAWNSKRRADFEPLAVGWCSGSYAPLPGQPDRTYRPHPDGRRAEAGDRKSKRLNSSH